jgi:hypothetical protein
MGRKKTKSKTKSKASAKVPRITYATLKVTPEDDKAYDEAVEQARAKLGNHYQMFINGEKRAATGEEMVHVCPRYPHYRELLSEGNQRRCKSCNCSS